MAWLCTNKNTLPVCRLGRESRATLKHREVPSLHSQRVSLPSGKTRDAQLPVADLLAGMSKVFAPAPLANRAGPALLKPRLPASRGSLYQCNKRAGEDTTCDPLCLGRSARTQSGRTYRTQQLKKTRGQGGDIQCFSALKERAAKTLPEHTPNHVKRDDGP